MSFSLGYWVWSFLAAPSPVPEQLIKGSPGILVDHMLDSWSAVPGAFPHEVREAYLAQFTRDENVHAICEQYRAAATLDYQHDEADRGRVKIRCPVLALWDHQGAVARWYDPLDVWRQWADDVRGRPLAAGHFLAEEAPTDVADELGGFFGSCVS